MRELQCMREFEPPAQPAPSAPANHGQQSDAPRPIANQGDPSDKFRVEGVWARMAISMSLDLGGSGEQFFQAFQHWATERKCGDNLDRQGLSMLLRADGNVPEKEAYYLRLDQGELEKRWKMAVKWI